MRAPVLSPSESDGNPYHLTLICTLLIHQGVSFQGTTVLFHEHRDKGQQVMDGLSGRGAAVMLPSLN